jgi:hypothetical protein
MKSRVNITLSKDVYDLAKKRRLNLSQTINSLLKVAFATEFEKSGRAHLIFLRVLTLKIRMEVRNWEIMAIIPSFLSAIRMNI